MALVKKNNNSNEIKSKKPIAVSSATDFDDDEFDNFDDFDDDSESKEIYNPTKLKHSPKVQQEANVQQTSKKKKHKLFDPPEKSNNSAQTSPVKTPSPKKKNINHSAEFISIPDRVLPVSAEFKFNQYTLGDIYEKSYCIFDFPPTVHLEWLVPVTRAGNCIVTYHITKADTNKLVEDIERTISQERVKSLESSSAVGNIESDAIIKRSEELARTIKADEGKAVNMTVSINVFGTTEKKLHDNENKIVSKMVGDSFTLRPMTHLQKEGLLESLPVCDNEFLDLCGIDVPLESWAAGLGIFTNQGLDMFKGTYLGKDKANEPVFWDIWDKSKEQNNSNVVITGTPGAGKSTTMKKMLLSQLSRGDTLIIFDAEREYVKLSKQYGGSVIEASASQTQDTTGNPTIINPLQLRDFPEAWADCRNQEDVNKWFEKNNIDKETFKQGPLSIHMSFLKQWFILYIDALSDPSNAEYLPVLERCLYQTYANKGIDETKDPRFMMPNDFPILSDLLNVIKTAVSTKKIGNFFITDHIAEICSGLETLLFSCTEGADRAIFNGYTQIDLESKFIVFDLHSLLDRDENLKNAQFYNITTYSWARMTRDRDERCILVVDEAHLFISKKHNQVFEWLSTASRRFRKYNCSLWIATQNISDFLQEEVRQYGEPLLNNPDLKFCMRQRGDDVEKVRTLFKLSPAEAQLIETSGRGDGLLMIGSKKHLYVHVKVEESMLKLISTTGGGA